MQLLHSTLFVSSRKGRCLPTGHATVVHDHDADFHITTDDKTVNGHIIWTNYEYALAYLCMNPNEDGSCPDYRSSLVVYSRNRDLPDEVIDELLPLSDKICANKEDFERVPQKSKCLKQLLDK